jgi:hypothetical protein
VSRPVAITSIPSSGAEPRRGVPFQITTGEHRAVVLEVEVDVARAPAARRGRPRRAPGRCDRLWCAPGNAGIAREARRAWRSTSSTATRSRLLPRERDRPRRGRPGGAAGRRAWPTGCARPASRRSGRRRAAARLEASKAFTKEICAACGIPTAAYELHRRRGGAAYLARAARRSSSRPTGSPPARAWTVATPSPRPRPPSTRCFAGGLRARRGASVVIEEFLEGEEASLFVLADGEGARRSARRRTTSAPSTATRAQHRRHGRLFARAGDDAGDDRARARRDRPPDARGDGAARHALRGVLYAGLMIGRRRAAADRIQRPLRRSRGAGADAAARRRSCSTPARLRRGAARRGAGQLGRGPRDDRGYGGTRAPGCATAHWSRMAGGC